MKRGEPFNVLRNPNSWEYVPRDPVSTAVAAAVAVKGTFAYTAVYVATQLAVSVAVNALVSALTPTPPSPKQSLLVNSRDAAAPQEFVYGEVRKGGPITYLETTRGGSVLHMIIPLAAHEIQSVEAIYINDEVATLSNDAYSNSRRSGAGWVTNRNWSDDPDEHEIRIFYHLGDQTAITDTFANSSVSTMDNTFLTESGNFNDVGKPGSGTFVGNGIAFMYVRFSYAFSVFQNGIPTITARIKGKKVFDPRTGTTAYSNNAALCIRDYLTSAYGLNDSNVNDTVFSNAANVCDENVTIAAGGTEKRYTLNGVVNAGQPYGDVLQQMVTSCAGTLFWGGGKWKLTVGEYNAPSKTFTLDDLRSDISLQTRTNLRDQFNKVQGTFVDQDQRYITADYPPIESATFLAQDDGVEQPLDLDLPFTTSSATAQRLAKMTLFRGREQMVFSADFGLSAFEAEVGEIVALTIDRYGWTNKEFEVVGWNFNSSSEGGDLRVSLTLRETSAAAFDWDAEESDIIGNDSNFVRFLEPVSNLTATSAGQVLADGTYSNAILVNWDSSPGATGYRVEWTVNNAVDYTAQGGIVEEADAVTTREQFIYKAFIEILYRQPGQSGFDYYNTGGGSGLDEAGVRAELAASPERSSLTYSGIVVQEPVSEYTIRPVLDNTIYHIRVKAVNTITGISSLWNSVTFDTTQDTTVPNPPTALTAVGYFQSAVLTWTAPTLNSEGSVLDDLFGYNIYRSLSNSFLSADLVGSTSSRSFSDGGLADNTTYYYWATAQDFSGNESAASVGTNATTNFLSAAQMVADIREEIGAARIDVVSSLPSGSGYNVGDFVFLTSDKKLYEWNGSSWIAAVGDIPTGSITSTQIANDAITTPKLATNSVTTDSLAANSVTSDQLTTNSVIAGKIAAGAVSADKIAVNDLAAIKADLGEVTAGSISTLSNGAGIQVNVAGKKNSFYVYQNLSGTYAMYAEHTLAGRGCVELKSNGGWTLLANNSRNNSSGFGPHMAINAGMTSGLGGRAWIGVAGVGGGYGVDVRTGGYYDSSGGGYNPFTGRHDGMIAKTETYELGDIVVDHSIIVRRLTDSFTELKPSTSANQTAAVGVVAKVCPEWYTPASFIDHEATEAAELAHTPTTEEPSVPVVTETNVSDYDTDYDLVTINSVGEGAVNVCGETGNISKGDLIVTSSTPGKGMKQSDDIVRSYTVAKAREDVTFSSPTEVKLVACIYLCG